MAKSEIYINKIEKFKEKSGTGFRLKQAVYNALLSCDIEKTDFPYKKLLEKYCIPGKEDYLQDEQYYLLTDDGENAIKSKRMWSEKERWLRNIADDLDGEIVFSKDSEPMVLVNGMLLRAQEAKEDSYNTEYSENFELPYEQYPRIINIKYDENGRHVLLETEKEKCIWE